MKPDRVFYPAASLAMLALTLAGFQGFYLRGHSFDGQPVPRVVLPYVVTHGTALTLWVVLLCAQTLLVASGNTRIHRRLGWAAAAVGLLIVVSGPLLAVHSIRARPGMHVIGITYPQFLLPMLAEMVLFAAFVSIGLALRGKPVLHRSMMLLATLSVLSGATSRIPAVASVFGENGWMGLFGAPVALGVLLLAVRGVLTRSLDRGFAAGLGALVCVSLLSIGLATSDAWTRVANAIALN